MAEAGHPARGYETGLTAVLPRTTGATCGETCGEACASGQYDAWMPTFSQMLLVLTNPSAGWGVVAASRASIGALMIRMILPAAMVAALAATIGTAVFNREWSVNFGYDTRAENAFDVGAATLLLLVSYSLVLAWVFARMGKLYQSSSNYADALKVVAFGTLPVWVVGAFMFFMPMALVGMAAFVYTCLLYSIGAGVVLGVKEAETAEFVAISLLVATIIMTVFGMAASAVGLV